MKRSDTSQYRFDLLSEIQSIPNPRDGQKAYAKDTAREYRYTSSSGWEIIPIKSEVDAKASTSYVDARTPRAYYNYTLKTNVFDSIHDLVVNNGTATVNLTFEGTSNGTSMFAEILTVRRHFNTSNSVDVASYTINGKVMTITAKRVGFTSSILSLITVLTGIQFNNVPNGTTLQVIITGK